MLAASPAEDDKLVSLKRSLSEKLDTIKKLDSEILDATPDDQIDGEIDQADQVMEKIHGTMCSIEKVLKASTPAPEAATGTRSSPSRTSPHGGKVKLPKLSLPHFNGNVMKWTTFWDSYESAIHNSTDLSDVDKFNYLHSLLERTAYDAIAGLTLYLSSANYTEAVDILKKRFGNKQLIVSKHNMESLLSVETVASDESLKALRRLYDSVESNIRSLKALGVDSEAYGAMLSSVLLNKLPPEFRLIISRKSSSGLNVEDLLKTVETELRARERSVSSNHGKGSQSQGSHRSHDKGLPTAAALLSGATGTVCCYCQQAHSSASCTSVSTLSARRQVLKSSGRCFNCLRKGHLVRDCRSASRCLKCKKKHHISVCDGGQNTDRHQMRQVRQENTVSPSTTPTLNPEAPPFESTPTASNLCTDGVKAVLLQTARALIHHPSRPHYTVEVRLLLDSGSQRSYVTQHVSKLLSLEPVGEQHLSIAMFGSRREQHQVCPVVKIEMLMKNYPPLSLCLFVVPTICEPLVGQPIATCIEENKHLAELQIADYFDGESSSNVDILIGSDHYWDLVTGGVLRATGGPIAIHTKLGWVLSGPAVSRDLNQCSMNLVTTHVLMTDTQHDSLTEQLCSFWELESLGIKEPEPTLYDELTNTIKFADGRYTVPLPWREFHEPLPDNYDLCFKRLRGLLHRLKQIPDVLQKYDDIMKDQPEKGVIEVVADAAPSNSLSPAPCCHSR